MSITWRSGTIGSRVLIALGVFVALILCAIGVFYGHRYRVRTMAERTLAEGKAAFESGQWEKARELLGRYLQKYPMGDAEALAQYAEVQLAARPLQSSNIGAAIGSYKRLLLIHARTPDEPGGATIDEVYRELARLYERTGNHTELGFIARERLEEVPDSIEATIWSAKSLLGYRRLDDARQKLVALIDRLREQEGNRPEYVEACILLSVMAAGEASRVGNEAVLGPLDDALEYDPEAVDALLQRAAAQRQLAGALFGDEREQMLQAARDDLERAEGLAPSDPVQRLMLAEAWINEGELDRAAKQLEACESPDPAELLETFVDPDNWVTTRFAVAGTLAMRTGASAEAAKLADDALASLTKFAQRRQVIPAAIGIYLAANRVPDARRCLDELLEKAALTQSSPAEEQQIRYLRASVALAEGRPYEAIELLETLAIGGASQPGVRRLLAEAYLLTDQSSRAAAALTDYLAEAPADLAAIKKLVRQHLRRQAWTQALAVARQGEQIAPNDLGIKLLRIQAQIRGLTTDDDADREALEAELVVLRDANPQRVEIRVCLAHLLAQADRPDDARAELQRAIADCDDSLLAELELAVLLATTDRPAEAVERSRQACEHHPAGATSWLALARLLASQGEHEQACAALQQGCEAVASEDDRQLLLLELGVVEVLHGNRAAGIARLQQLATDAPDDIDVRDVLLSLPDTLAETEVAEALIQEIKEIEGETGLRWRFHQARLLLTRPDWRAQRQEIVTLLRYCVNGDRGWAAPVLALGRMYEGLGSFSEAERLYSDALERSGAVSVADRLLSILQRQRRFDEARRVLDEVRRRTDSRLLDDRSISLSLQSGDLSGAISELQPRLAADDATPEDLIAMARLVYLQNEGATQALDYLEQARALAPDSSDCVTATAFILKEEGRVDEARQLIDEFAGRRGDFDSHLLRAAFYQWIGDAEQAAQDYARLVEHSEDSYGYAALGEYYAQSGQLTEAIDIWEQGLERFPNDVRLRRGVTKALIMRALPGDHERAEHTLAELEAELPADGEMYWMQAELKLSQGTQEAVDQACALLEQAIELDPVRIEPYLRLAPILLDRGQYDAARDLVVRAMAIYPADDRLLLVRAAVELTLNNMAAAKDSAQRVLRSHPESVAAADLLAEIAMRAGDFESLLAVRDRILQAADRQPGNERLQIAIAVSLVADGQRDAALERLEPPVIVAAADRLLASGAERFREDARLMYEHVIERAPQNVQAYVGLASLAYAQGDAASAISTYRDALEVAPSNTAVLNNLAWTLAEQNPDDEASLAEALRLADEAVRIAPEDANLHDTRAFVLSKLPGRLEETRSAYQKCYELTAPDTPARARALLRLLRVCHALNDRDAVRRLIDEADRIDEAPGTFSPQERAEMKQMLSEAVESR